MYVHAKGLEFEEAAHVRDQISSLRKLALGIGKELKT
jgi:protein-arginine kinase activator protein McsA